MLMKSEIQFILTSVTRGDSLSAAEAKKVLADAGDSLLDIMACARLAASGGRAKPFTCGIVNAKSGLCQENCAYCAQSRHHTTATPVYPLISEDDMLRRAEEYAGAGVDYMGMVTSGVGPGPKDFDKLCRMAERIGRAVDIRLCASLGVLAQGQAEQLRAAGFTSYHHNLETARSNYPSVCPSHDYDAREATVRAAKAAGLRVCTGGIFGVGESWQQRLELAQALAELDVDSIPVNYLVAVEGTPLAGTPPPPPREALLIIALLRLMHPDRDIVVCGGRSHCLGEYAPLLFAAGANGLMVGNYLTTTGDPLALDMKMLQTLGIKHAEN